MRYLSAMVFFLIMIWISIYIISDKEITIKLVVGGVAIISCQLVYDFVKYINGKKRSILKKERFGFIDLTKKFICYSFVFKLSIFFYLLLCIYSMLGLLWFFVYFESDIDYVYLNLIRVVILAFVAYFVRALYLTLSFFPFVFYKVNLLVGGLEVISFYNKRKAVYWDQVSLVKGIASSDIVTMYDQYGKSVFKMSPCFPAYKCILKAIAIENPKCKLE